MALVSSRFLSGDPALRTTVLGTDFDAIEDWHYPDPINDEFDGSSLDSKWSWMDQGTASASVSNGMLVAFLNESTNRIRGIYQNTPSGNWTIRAKLYQPSMQYDNFGPWTLFAGQSTTQEIRGVGYWGDDANVVYSLRWTTPSSSAVAWNLSVARYQPDLVYSELEWDGTNLIARASWDGVVWRQLASTALGYTPAIVGIGLGNNSGRSVTYTAEWFRRVA